MNVADYTIILQFVGIPTGANCATALDDMLFMFL